jgi:hypothetical protein
MSVLKCVFSLAVVIMMRSTFVLLAADHGIDTYVDVCMVSESASLCWNGRAGFATDSAQID